MTKQSITFDFSTSNYVWTHGREPKGYGAWAFEFDGREPVWAPSSNYADAKRYVKNLIRGMAPADYCGTVTVTVCT